MTYYMAYLADGIEYVRYHKMKNKDEVIDFLIAGHNSENWTTLCKSLKECKAEVQRILECREVA